MKYGMLRKIFFIYINVCVKFFFAKDPFRNKARFLKPLKIPKNRCLTFIFTKTIIQTIITGKESIL